jgi:hypothetical protein
LGHWLARKWYGCKEKKVEAEGKLVEFGIPEAVLRDEWAKQVKEQTRPVVRE